MVLSNSQWLASAGGWEVTHSLDYEKDSTHMLKMTTSSAATDVTTGTYSAWVKRESVSYNSATIFCTSRGVSGSASYVNFVSGNTITAFGGVVDGTAGTNHPYKASSSSYASTSDWYHIVCAIDTAQSDANKFRVYVNNSEITSWSAAYYAVTDQPSPFNYGSAHQTEGVEKKYLGAQQENTGVTADAGQNWFDGLMAEPCFVDGQQLTPSAFGVSDGGTWSAIDPRIAISNFGNNGFYLRHNNSGALGEDSSGKGNDFTLFRGPSQSTTIPPFVAS